jgi:hypothetical protein
MRNALKAVIITIAVSTGVGAQEQKRGPSTPEERARAVQIGQSLEAQPTDPSLHDDYIWLFRWATEVPDLTIPICSANMPWKEKYKHSGDLAGVVMAATVAFVIQHPDEGKDGATAGIAAMESTLRAYQKIVEQDPKVRSKEMDELVEVQRQGKLAEYIRGRWTRTCKK